MEKEKKIKNSVEPINIQKISLILEQMKFYIGKISYKGIYGTGFFCYIPFGQDKLKVLITNYHVINKEYLENNENIIISLNDEKIIYSINLNIERKIYLNQTYDTTIIEIKEQDNIKNFLELDENIFNEASESFYDSKSIYILQYPNGNNSSVSFGFINNIKDCNIYHFCSTETGSSGSPIINLFNNKVIGIHKEGSKIFEFNKGTFLKKPVKEFYKQNSQSLGLVGLEHIGYRDSAFMNSFLQCLSQTKKLTDFFLSDKFKDSNIYNDVFKRNKRLILSPLYSKIIEFIWDEKNEFRRHPHASAKEFFDEILMMNPIFNGCDFDLKYFIFFILERFHFELKTIHENNLQKMPLNSYVKNKEFIHFIEEFNNNSSIISDLFIGINEITYLCLNCEKNYSSKNKKPPEFFNYNSFYFLDFPLKEIKKMKNNEVKLNNSKNNLNGDLISIYDCLHYNQKIELLEKENYCNICKEKCDSKYTTKIFYPPNILILIFDYGKKENYSNNE